MTTNLPVIKDLGRQANRYGFLAVEDEDRENLEDDADAELPKGEEEARARCHLIAPEDRPVSAEDLTPMRDSSPPEPALSRGPGAPPHPRSFMEACGVSEPSPRR